MPDENGQSKIAPPGFAGAQPTPELLFFAGNQFVDGEPGTVGQVQIEVPTPHYVLWGQRVYFFARETGFDSPPYSEYTVEGVASSSDILDETARPLGPTDGDSPLRVSPNYEFGVQLPEGGEAWVRLIPNAQGRFGGFEIGPFRAPSADDAMGLGEIVANKLERSAALANVALRFPIVRAFRPDRKELRQSIFLPYPIVDLPAWTESRFPAVAILAATLAEGRRSTSIFYRALVFFKIVETFIEKIQPQLLKTFNLVQLPLSKLELSIPEDPFQRISPRLVGLSYTEYRVRVQERIRNVVAHLDPSSPIVPFELEAERETRTASIALHYIATEIISYFDRCIHTLAEKNVKEAVGFRYDGVDKRRRRNRKR